MNTEPSKSKIEKGLFSLFSLGLAFYFFWFKFLFFKKIILVEHTNLIYFTILRFLKGNLSFSSQAVQVISQQYFLPLLARPFFLTLFILGLIKVYKKEKRLFQLIFSFMILMLIGLFFIGGERVLLFTWILTFFIFAFGLDHLWQLLKNKKQRYLLFLLLINLSLELVYVFFIFQPKGSKEIILREFFIFSKFLLLLILGLNLIIKKRIVLILSLFGIISFFSYLFLEKAAMVVFQKNKNNFEFKKEIFLKEIKSHEKLIIYNDNLSYALFSGSGLMENEAVKMGFLEKNDLRKGAYFITTKRKFSKCQNKTCILKISGLEVRMEKKASDENFLLYEF